MPVYAPQAFPRPDLSIALGAPPRAGADLVETNGNMPTRKLGKPSELWRVENLTVNDNDLNDVHDNPIKMLRLFSENVLMIACRLQILALY